jgi:hypothetical protein
MASRRSEDMTCGRNSDYNPAVDYYFIVIVAVYVNFPASVIFVSTD